MSKPGRPSTPPSHLPPPIIPGHPMQSISHPFGSSSNSPQPPGGLPNPQALQTEGWSGERMLHIYMLDYARKRAFADVVTALSTTTGIRDDIKAPIDAPQGLLYEWWVVFWEIFTAKSSDVASNPDARSYLRSQVAQKQDQMRSQYMGDVKPGLLAGPPQVGNGAPGGFISGPGGPPPGMAPSHGMQGQPMVNGMLPPYGQPYPPQPPQQNHGQPNGLIPHPGPPGPLPPQPQLQQPQTTGPQPYPPGPLQQPQQPRPSGPPQQPPLGAPQPPAENGAGGPPHPQNLAGPSGNQFVRPGPSAPQVVGNRVISGPLGSQQQRPQMQPQGSFVGSPQAFSGGNRPSPPNGNPAGAMRPPSQIPNHFGPPGQSQQPPSAAPTPAGNSQVQTPQQQFQPGIPMHPAQAGRTPTPGQGQQGMTSPSRQGVMHGAMGPGMISGVSGPGGMMAGRPTPPQLGPGQPRLQGPVQLGQADPAVFEQVVKHLGIAGKSPENYTNEEKLKLASALRKVNPLGNAGTSTPRPGAPGAGGGQYMVPAVPNMPHPGQINTGFPPQGPPNPTGGPPQQPQMPFPPQQTMGPSSASNLGKRSGSPNAVDTTSNELTPPEKRRRPNSQGGNGSGVTPTSTGPPNGFPLQQGRPMVNGTGPLTNGMHPGTPTMMHQQGRPPQGRQQQGQAHKPSAIMANPNPSGLPIMRPTGDPGDPGSGRGPTPKMPQPSPSMINRLPASMPPPSHTPKAKEEQASPHSKAIVPGATLVSNPGMGTPVQAFAGSSGILSLTNPSPSAILAANAPLPSNISRPGSSSVNVGGLNLGASNAILNTGGGLGNFPDVYNLGLSNIGIGTGDGFNGSLSLIHDYENGRTIKDEPLHLAGASGPEFDILNWVNELPGAPEDENAIGGKAV